MMTMPQFVRLARDEVRREEQRFGVMLVECDYGVGLWDVVCSANRRTVQDYIKRSPFAAVIYPDGSAQLLGRDEDECLLFQTLWELERW